MFISFHPSCEEPFKIKADIRAGFAHRHSRSFRAWRPRVVQREWACWWHGCWPGRCSRKVRELPESTGSSWSKGQSWLYGWRRKSTIPAYAKPLFKSTLNSSGSTLWLRRMDIFMAAAWNRTHKSCDLSPVPSAASGASAESHSSPARWSWPCWGQSRRISEPGCTGPRAPSQPGCWRESWGGPERS